MLEGTLSNSILGGSSRSLGPCGLLLTAIHPLCQGGMPLSKGGVGGGTSTEDCVRPPHIRACLSVWRAPCRAGDTEGPPELVNWKTEWMRQLLLKLQQPKVEGLAGMDGVRHQAKLVFQAAAVAGVRHEVIESAAKRFTFLQSDKRLKP